MASVGLMDDDLDLVVLVSGSCNELDNDVVGASQGDGFVDFLFGGE